MILDSPNIGSQEGSVSCERGSPVLDGILQLDAQARGATFPGSGAAAPLIAR